MTALILGTLLSTTGHALPGRPLPPTDCTSSVLKPAKFEDVDKLQKTFAPAQAAVFLGNCSATFVSDEAHILTASHCLQNCLERTPIYQTKAAPKELNCLMNVNGELTAVRVLLTSRCEPLSSAEEMGRTGKDPCPDDGDIALVQMLKPPAHFSCLSIGRKRPAEADQVTAMGYPMAVRRRGGDSNGKSLYISRGQAIKSSTCTRVGQGAKDGPIQMLELNNLNKRMIQTTADGYFRQSGGALMNESGELVGVFHGFAGPSAKDPTVECTGNMLFESTERLMGMAKIWGSDGELSKMKCSARKVGTQTSGI